MRPALQAPAGHRDCPLYRGEGGGRHRDRALTPGHPAPPRARGQEAGGGVRLRGRGARGHGLAVVVGDEAGDAAVGDPLSNPILGGQTASPRTGLAPVRLTGDGAGRRWPSRSSWTRSPACALTTRRRSSAAETPPPPSSSRRRRRTSSRRPLSPSWNGPWARSAWRASTRRRWDSSMPSPSRRRRRSTSTDTSSIRRSTASSTSWASRRRSSARLRRRGPRPCCRQGR
jgi:hypothetical protein